MAFHLALKELHCLDDTAGCISDAWYSSHIMVAGFLESSQHEHLGCLVLCVVS